MNPLKTAKAKSVETGSSPAGGPQKVEHVATYGQTIRETIDAVVFAFVLAFLFRTFEAEAFVIPTGSMAPTLQGLHKEIECPECGYTYRVSASSEGEDDIRPGPQRRLTRAELESQRREKEVVGGTCPMCRFTARQATGGHGYPSYSGDRILVGKFPYEFEEPKRWDVVVFKYPEEAKTNFIKRLVGLPGETVRIYHGDIFTGRENEEFEIQRRSPDKLHAMAQIVFDNDYASNLLTRNGWPLRWQPWPSASAGQNGEWTTPDEGRSFATDGRSPEPVWVRYQHFVPTDADWESVKSRPFSAADGIRPQLITDFYAYNTNIQRGRGPKVQGLHWVGDLLLDAELTAEGSTGLVLLDLVKAGRHFGCTFDLASGQATLSANGLADFRSTAQTAVKGPGKHRVMFANVDRQLRLWVDGSIVEFDGDTTYPELGDDVPKSTPQDPGDLAPAGIGSQGAAVQVNHLRLLRDIYYIADREDERQMAGPISDYPENADIPHRTPEELARFMSNPREWEPQTPGQRGPFQLRRDQSFLLEADQFFMLGDNSPESKDSRLWGREKYVDRKLLIGKALWIYWPASHNRISGTRIPFPFFPNFPSMGLVR